MPALEHLIKTVDKKGISLKGKVKTGRTHLMDAMPIDFSQELSGWSAQLQAVRKSIISASKELLNLPQGGTAIAQDGTAIAEYSQAIAENGQAIAQDGPAIAPEQFHIGDDSDSESSVGTYEDPELVGPGSEWCVIAKH